MKSASLFLLLCGIARSVASSSCTWEEVENCGEKQPKNSEFFKTETELEEFCSVYLKKMECEIKVMERCPNLDDSNSLELIKENRRLFRLICDKENPLRRKFLDNAECLIQFMKNKAVYCSDGEEVDFTVEKAEYCRNLRKVLKCAEEKIVDICNEDTKEVFMESINPVFILRQLKCE